MNRRFFFLVKLESFADIGLLLLRALTGVFLIYGVLDNVMSAERMREFADFLAANNFPAPQLMAPLSVYTQLFCGIGLAAGFLTRWAGIVLAVNFLVAVFMVHLTQDFRGMWPAIVLIGIGLQFALTGAGAHSIDAMILRRTKN